jgi:diketogulonate reductase-like aldo/keto reductase
MQAPSGQALNEVPRVGLGTAGITGNASVDIIAGAIQKGFRHIDSAAIYKNENTTGAGIAEGLRRTGLKRENIWVTTKLWKDR